MTDWGFKIIAITPIEGCHTKYLKILQPGHPYYLYNNYKIQTTFDGVEQIIVEEDSVPKIYDVANIKINISAIVGKNGSGKSSLVELIYVMFYNIAKQQKVLKKKDEEGNFYKLEEGIRAAIYFEDNATIYKLEQIDLVSTLYQFNKNNIGYFQADIVRGKQMMATLFYNIVVNYSHYALNESDLGHWVRALFEKNDAYQTPIVLNPFRENGNIDINNENNLVRSRMVVNILEKNLVFTSENKLPKTLHFALDRKKFQVNKKSKKIALVRSHSTKAYVLPAIYEVFFNDKLFKPSKGVSNTYAIEYILNKLRSIVIHYKHYLKYSGYSTQKTNERVLEFLKALKDDESHITFKLKQALNFLYFDLFPKDQENFDIPVSELANQINRIARARSIPRIELTPPSFLSVDIEFSDSEHRFSKLSSGEKQKTYALASLVYHLKNLDSILKNIYKKSVSGQLIRYRNINVIFDEIELYYHPDLQRRFIKDLLDSIHHAGLKSINSINFIFITHSPFILSDIPEEQAMFLEVVNEKSIQKQRVGKTFGGNIHDLLSNNFFLDKNGYMGEFAKSIILDAHTYLTQQASSDPQSNTRYSIKWSKSMVRHLIDMIGEPLISRSLNDLYIAAFLQSRSSIDEEIARLQNLRKTKPE